MLRKCDSDQSGGAAAVAGMRMGGGGEVGREGGALEKCNYMPYHRLLYCLSYNPASCLYLEEIFPMLPDILEHTTAYRQP